MFRGKVTWGVQSGRAEDYIASETITRPQRQQSFVSMQF